jgi:hypothetical protein
MNRTSSSRLSARAETANSLPVVVNQKEADAAINAAMRRKGLTMDCSAFRRRHPAGCRMSHTLEACAPAACAAPLG